MIPGLQRMSIVFMLKSSIVEPRRLWRSCNIQVHSYQGIDMYKQITLYMLNSICSGDYNYVVFHFIWPYMRTGWRFFLYFGEGGRFLCLFLSMDPFLCVLNKQDFNTTIFIQLRRQYLVFNSYRTTLTGNESRRRNALEYS